MLFIVLLLCSSFNLLGFTEQELLSLGRKKLTFNVLKLTEQHIDETIKEIHNKATCYRLNKQKILTTLKDEVQDNVLYYSLRTDNSRNYKSLFKAVACAAAALGVAYGAYYIFDNYYNVYRIERNEIQSELEKAGITFDYNYRSAPHFIYLKVIGDQKGYENKINRFIELLNILEKNKKAPLTSFVLSCISYGLLENVIHHIKAGLTPQYKEYFEKYRLILDKINKALDD